MSSFSAFIKSFLEMTKSSRLDRDGLAEDLDQREAKVLNAIKQVTFVYMVQH